MVRFRNGAQVDGRIRKDSNGSCMPVGTNGCPQEALAARQPSPATPCRQLRGCPGQPRQIPAMAVKAQVTATPVSCPLPAAREGEPGDRQVRGQVSHPPGPGRGINRDTVGAPAAHAGRRQARATRHLARAPSGG